MVSRCLRCTCNADCTGVGTGAICGDGETCPELEFVTMASPTLVGLVTPTVIAAVRALPVVMPAFVRETEFPDDGYSWMFAVVVMCGLVRGLGQPVAMAFTLSGI